MPTCNAFPFKEWGAAPSCVTFCRKELRRGHPHVNQGQESGTGKGTFGPDRVRPSVVVVFAEHQDRCARARLTKYLRNLRTVRPSVRPCVVLARWMDQDNREGGGRKGRPLARIERGRERCDEVVALLPSLPSPPLGRSMPSPSAAVLLLLPRYHEMVGREREGEVG